LPPYFNSGQNQKKKPLNIHTHKYTNKQHKQVKNRGKSGVAKQQLVTVQPGAVQAGPQGSVQPPGSASSTNLLPRLRMPHNLPLHLKQNRIGHAYILAQTYKKLPFDHLC